MPSDQEVYVQRRGVHALDRNAHPDGLVHVGGRIGKGARLAAAEVTFLRKHLEYTGARLAKALGVTGPTVSRWESGREPIGPSADRLLRALVLMHDGTADRFDPARFEAIEEGGAPLRLTLRRDSRGNWAAAA